MTFAKIYLRSDLTALIKERMKKFAMMMDDADIDDVMRQCVRKLSEVMYDPRDLVVTAHSTKLDLTAYRIDEVCTVFFSNDRNILSGSPLGPDVGIMPFLLSGGGIASFTNVVDFLAMKGELNIINRQLRTYPDWDYKGGFMYFNRTFAIASIEYLPFLDAVADSWELYQHEYAYLIERIWYSLNLRNAEALMSAVTLGLGEKATPVANHWMTKLDKLDVDWSDKAAMSYVG